MLGGSSGTGPVRKEEFLHRHADALKSVGNVFGFMVYYTVPDMKLALLLYQNFIKNATFLSRSFRDILYRGDLSPYQAWRGALTQMVRTITRDNPDRKFKFFSRDLVQIQDLIDGKITEAVRLIIREGVDKKKAEWQPTEVVKVYYNAKTHTMRWDWVTTGAYDLTIQTALEKAQRDFEGKIKEISGDRLRAAIKRAFDTLAPISLKRSGGLYFVRAARESEINMIGQVVNWVNQQIVATPSLTTDGNVCEFGKIGMIDTDEHTGLVRSSALRDATAKHASAAVKLKKVLDESAGGKGVDAEKLNEVLQEARQVLALNKEHRELLGTALEELAEFSDKLIEQTNKALKRVR